MSYSSRISRLVETSKHHFPIRSGIMLLLDLAYPEYVIERQWVSF